jgi:hypothetical protein
MEELFKRALDLFPRYIGDLLSLLSGPKRFVAHRVRSGTPLESASIFLAISVAINFLLKLPFSDESPAYEILRTAAFSLVVWTMAGVVIWLAWRAVGGAGPIDRTLAIAFYLFGVLEYVMSVTALAIAGAMKTIDPPLYDAFVQAFRDGRLLQYVVERQLLERTSMQVSLGLMRSAASPRWSGLSQVGGHSERPTSWAKADRRSRSRSPVSCGCRFGR